MITISTPTSNSISNDEKEDQKMMTVFNEETVRLYDSLKPALNKLIKNPSDKTVQNILSFSKSLSN